MEITKCLECGKEIVQAKTGRKRKFCNKNCANKYSNRIHRTFYKNGQPVKAVKIRPKPKKTLAEVNALAREKNMSYGEYMMRHGY